MHNIFLYIGRMKREETVDYNIKVLWHSISRMYNQQALEHQLTMSMGFVLLNIDIENGTPATKIAPQLGLESRSLTRLLKSMQDKGYICKQSDKKDRRSVRIFLTDLGLQKREISAKTVKEFNFFIRDHLSSKDLGQFISVMQDLHSIIEDYQQKI